MWLQQLLKKAQAMVWCWWHEWVSRRWLWKWLSACVITGGCGGPTSYGGSSINTGGSVNTAWANLLRQVLRNTASTSSTSSTSQTAPPNFASQTSSSNSVNMSYDRSNSGNQPATGGVQWQQQTQLYPKSKIRQHQILQALKEHRLNQISMLYSLQRAIITNND